jgi:hypothetical protein
MPSNNFIRRSIMNPRLLGTLCIVGGAAYLLNGLRFFIAGGPVEDQLEAILSAIWALGAICGILGIIAARATGTHRVVRLLSYLPIVAFLMVFTGLVPMIVNPANDVNPLIIFGLLGVVVAMLLNGTFTVVAKVWRGWKLLVPFLPAIMPFVGIALGSLIGIEGAVNVILVALSWMLLGYAVMTSPAPARVQAAIA